MAQTSPHWSTAACQPLNKSQSTRQAGKFTGRIDGNDTIKSADLDGSNVTTLVNSGLGTSIGIAVDPAGGKIYWTDSGNDTIKSADLDGSNVTTLVNSDLTSPEGIAIPALTNVPRVTVTTTDGSVLLDWDDIEDATDYQYRSTS